MTCALYGTAFTWALNAYGSDGGFSQSAVFLSVVWEAEGIFRPQILLLHSMPVCHMPHYKPPTSCRPLGHDLLGGGAICHKQITTNTRQRTLGMNYMCHVFYIKAAWFTNIM